MEMFCKTYWGDNVVQDRVTSVSTPLASYFKLSMEQSTETEVEH